jgi:hypothetical protein
VRPRASEHDPFEETTMDGTVTAGGKGLPYLRDHFFPAMTAQVVAGFEPRRVVTDAVHTSRAASVA